MDRVRTTEDVRVVVANTITRPADTTPYTIGDVLSNVTTNDFFTFADCVNAESFDGMIVQAELRIDSAVVVGPSVDLILFSKTIAEVADNGPAAFTDPEMLTFLCQISFPTAGWQKTGGGSQVQTLSNIDIRLKPLLKAKSIFCQPILQNGYVPTSGEIFTATLFIKQN